MDTYTLVHVILSLIGIVSGLIVLFGLLRSDPMNGWTLLFLVATVATSVTGFGFPFHGVTPAIILGILSLIVLALAIAARYTFHLAGAWRWIFVVSAVVALYFNCFVLVVQSFLHIRPCASSRRTAPSRSSPSRRELSCFFSFGAESWP